MVPPAPADDRGPDAARLLPLVYDELRAVAAAHLAGERPDHTLQPTALVHEAFVRLAALDRIDWRDARHFLAAAARTMRRVLVDHARGRLRAKRGGGATRVELAPDLWPAPVRDADVLALHDALDELARLDPRQAEVVELRFFGGLTVAEAAAALGVSKRTAEDDWAMARAWLLARLSGEVGG